MAPTSPRSGSLARLGFARLSALLAVTLAVAGSVWVAPAASGTSIACATEASRPHAGLAIDNGQGVTTYCVGLDADSVTGVRLVELAAAQYGLTYRFGSGGQAVCQLEGVGPKGDDCFSKYPKYWGYWHARGNGWKWAQTGPGDARISDGDMDGWTWGTGDTAGTHPSPPALGLGAVCAAPSPSPGSTATSADPPAATEAGGTKGGPPVGAILAAAAVVVFGIAGAFRLRVSRRDREEGNRT
jgi:hypothetical protein